MAAAAPIPSGNPDFRASAFTESLPADYIAPATDEGGEGVQQAGQVSEADLRKALDGGARIVRAVVVEIGTGDYVAYLQLDIAPDWRLMATRRYAGTRTWTDFRSLHRSLVRLGYGDAVCVYPEHHPGLATVGIGVEPPPA